MVFGGAVIIAAMVTKAKAAEPGANFHSAAYKSILRMSVCLRQANTEAGIWPGGHTQGWWFSRVGTQILEQVSCR